MFASSTEDQKRALGAARSLVVKRIHADVSVRASAESPDYSPAGLYTHFHGRTATLSALADVVRAELSAALARAARGEANTRERSMFVGCAYVDFAVEHPAECELLFRWTRSRGRRRADERQSSFDLLRRLFREACPDAAAALVDTASLGLWSAAHGLTSLRTSHLSSFPGGWRKWCRQVIRAKVEGALCARS